MKSILVIGHNDLRLFFKSKAAYVWLFAVPLMFVYFVGAVNRGPGDPANRKPPVLVENLDTNFLGRVFLDELGAQGMWLLDPTNRGSAARTVRIPPDFTRNVLQGKPTKVEYAEREDSAEADAALLELRLVRALIALNSHLLETVTRFGPLERLTENELRQAMNRPDPVTLNAHFAGRHPVPAGFNFSVPAILVMYLMMNLLIFGGATLAAERRNGVIKRLMVYPVTHAAVVLGKIYGLLLLGAAQTLFLLAAGKYAFGVNVGANLPGVILVLLEFSWVAGSLGVLAGSLLPAEDRVAGICVLASLLMAALGGCWWPLELAPPALKAVAFCLPTGWALQALHQLISFGGGLGATVKPLLVLAAYGVGANLLAARFFRS
ncbi:MAG: ABC transporter permease [Verrucomicrobia bacterium]|nr:ABC transporter permease [Verrucomicrobiota bacterium]